MEASSSVLHQVLPTCPKKQKQQLGHQPPPNPPPEKRLRPQPEQSLRCPRCDSTNTKFCYYNNYSLSQPRYFCKGCRRYWTHGGTLRNVPVGGGCRKNKARISTSTNPKRSSPGDQKSMLSTEVSSTSTNLFLPILPTPASLPFTFSAGVKTPPSSDHDGNNGGSDYLMPTMSPYLLVDLLRDGSLENAYQSMLLQGGGGEEAPLLPFGEVGNGENGEAGKQEGCRGGEMEVGGLQQQLQVEGGERDLWSSAGPNWHGLLNSTI